MPVRLQFDGMNEFREALRQLPEELTQEASVIVEAHAELARSAISVGYPLGPTGNLKNRVVTIHNAGRRFITKAIVKSQAPHASIFENGTKRRQTAKGANRGVMPRAPESQRMIPKVIRIRRRLMTQLIALVRRAGFEVPDAA